MNTPKVTTALLTVILVMIGCDVHATDDRSGRPHHGNSILSLSADAARYIQPASWDVSISVGKRDGYRYHRHGNGHFRTPRHSHRHYGYRHWPHYDGYLRGPYHDYRDQGHPDYGYRSYGYRSNRYDSDGNYHYKGGRYRYYFPYGPGSGYGYGHRHRR
jgi:hypothetical protein